MPSSYQAFPGSFPPPQAPRVAADIFDVRQIIVRDPSSTISSLPVQADTDGGHDDAGEVAAMVYVGDVYSLRYAASLGAPQADTLRRERAQRVWPFLR